MKTFTELYPTLRKIKSIYDKKNVNCRIYAYEDEVGVTWRRGPREFTAGIGISHNRGYLHAVENGEEVLFEKFPNPKAFSKRVHALIRRKLI